MALTDIIQQLLEKAQKEADSVAMQTKERKQLILSEYEANEMSVMAEIDAKKEADNQQLVREAESRSSKEKRKYNLQAKSRIMKHALEVFYTSLVALSDVDYKNLMSALISNMNLSGSGIFYVPEKRLAITTEIVPSGFQVQASQELEGGALVQQGNAQIDIRFKNLVYSEFKTEIEAFFAQKLNLIAA